MDSNDTPSQLNLNPGPPGRKRASATKCLLAGVAFLLCLGMWFFISNVYGAAYSLPHRSMYQNQTHEEVTNRSRVVRPLIDDDQTFDLAVTVWIKRPDAEQLVYKAQHISLADTIQTKTGIDATNDSEWVSFLQEHDKWSVVALPIFSDVVFRGLKLSDKNIFADVNLTVPTAVFRDAKLNTNYLRASVVLIPTSPSLLDYLTSYTHWLPASSKGGPCLSYPFPLGSDNYKRRTMVDAAIDDMGIEFSLLRLVDVPRKCLTGSDDEYEEEDSDKIKHPYIETRTQLRVVDETHIFNRKSFDKAHKALTKTARGEGQDNWNVSRRGRSYILNGNWETRLQLAIPDANSDTTMTEYAYGPYLSVLRSWLPVSPKDYLKVPVNREICSGFVEEQKSMNITWHLSFTGRTPGKFALADHNINVESIKSFDQWHNASDHKLATLHDSAMMYHGLYGHRFGKDTHPRRRMLASLLITITSYIIWILDLHYWYTCTSTVSISVPGYAMIAASGLLSTVIDITARAKEQSGLPGLAWVLVTRGVKSALVPLLILKAIARGEFVLRYKVIPWLRFSLPTHSERVSARIDARTSALIRVAVLACLIAGWWLFTPETVWVVPPTTYPTATEVDSPRNPASMLATCLLLMGKGSQLILNHRTRVFAGSYKTSVFLTIFQTLVETLSLVQSLFGTIAARAGLSVSFLIETAVLALTAYQAVILPSAVRTDEDEKGM